MSGQLLGRYLTLAEFCTCTQTYRKYADQIDPHLKNAERSIHISWGLQQKWMLGLLLSRELPLNKAFSTGKHPFEIPMKDQGKKL